MSTDHMKSQELWMILQDRRRQAAEAARERLARPAPDETRADAGSDRPAISADHRRLRPADGAPGR